MCTDKIIETKEIEMLFIEADRELTVARMRESERKASEIADHCTVPADHVLRVKISAIGRCADMAATDPISNLGVWYATSYKHCAEACAEARAYASSTHAN